MKKIILCLCVFSYVVADISITGDARFRPRYESVDNGLPDEASEETSDFVCIFDMELQINFSRKL